MYVKNFSYVIKNSLPRSFCERIINFALSQKERTAITGGFSTGRDLSPEELKVQHKTRNSHLVWLTEPWVHRTLEPIILDANKKAGWNFDLNSVENFQFTKYKGKLNQHYTWHTDQGAGPSEHRKLSFVVQLSDPKNYVGGQFLINPDEQGAKKSISFNKEWEEEGAILFFPSFLLHTVTPVTRGTRYSLVGWCRGPTFR